MVEAEIHERDDVPIGFTIPEPSSEENQSTQPDRKNHVSGKPRAKCPDCGCERLYRDGFRYLTDDVRVQRWLCRTCGLRFTVRRRPQRVGKVSTEPLKGGSAIVRGRQICATLARGARNLAEVARQEEAPREGTLQRTSAQGEIIQFVWWLQKEAYRPSTIEGWTRLLKILVKRDANLYDPESIKQAIAKQNWGDGRKANAVNAYTNFLRMHGQTWDPPFYRKPESFPWIPTEQEIDQLTAGCSKRLAAYLQLLKETGMRAGEAFAQTWDQIDIENRTVRVKPEKGSNPRIFRLSNKLLGMLTSLPKTGDRIFGRCDYKDFYGGLILQRKRIAYKLNNPRIKHVTPLSIRHWKGTTEYHRTRDILHVKEVLGHKDIRKTLIYIQMDQAIFKDESQYICKAATTVKQAEELIEAGFEFVCDIEYTKLFRKLK